MRQINLWYYYYCYYYYYYYYYYYFYYYYYLFNIMFWLLSLPSFLLLGKSTNDQRLTEWLHYISNTFLKLFTIMQSFAWLQSLSLSPGNFPFSPFLFPLLLHQLVQQYRWLSPCALSCQITLSHWTLIFHNIFIFYRSFWDMFIPFFRVF